MQALAGLRPPDSYVNEVVFWTFFPQFKCQSRLGATSLTHNGDVRKSQSSHLRTTFPLGCRIEPDLFGRATLHGGSTPGG